MRYIGSTQIKAETSTNKASIVPDAKLKVEVVTPPLCVTLWNASIALRNTSTMKIQNSQSFVTGLSNRNLDCFI